MDFKVVQQSQWRMLNDLKNSTFEIREKCLSVLALFEDLVAKPTFLGEGAIKFERTDSGNVIAHVKTVLGDGRVVLAWDISGAELLGLMLFQRARIDQYEKSFWETVWGLNIPRYDNPYSGSGENSVCIPLYAHFEQDRRAAVMSAMISILHGLVNGPAVDGK